MSAENPFKKDGPLSAPTGKGPATKNSLHENLTTIRAKTKSLIVEAASRGFIPPWAATLALRVLRLAAA